jgi:hypothetical protein
MIYSVSTSRFLLPILLKPKTKAADIELTPAASKPDVLLLLQVFPASVLTSYGRLRSPGQCVSMVDCHSWIAAAAPVAAIRKAENILERSMPFILAVYVDI